jgi:protein-S-isoprenylcysteine O-methyltransferase Ste14
MRFKVPPVVLMLLIAVAMYLVAPWLPVIDASARVASLLAIAIFVAGALFAVLGVLEFRRAQTTVDPMNIDKASSLVTSGVYRISRNPMYVGFALVVLAVVVYLRSPVLLLGVALFVAYITRFQILPEEQFMRGKFGAQYESYMQQVRRWL